MTHTQWARVVALLLLPAGLAGCGEAKIEFLRYPAFYDPAIKTVAVAPMGNRTLHPMAGDFLAKRLAAELRANGTYKVVGPDALENRLAEAKVELPPNPSVEQFAEALGEIGGIDAFIAGEVTRFGAGQGVYTEVYDDPWYYGRGYYGYGVSIGYSRAWHRRRGHYLGGYYGAYYPVYRSYTYTQANVAAEAAMFRVPDAEMIHSGAAPATSKITSRGGPSTSVDETLTSAADRVARQIVGTFAVVPWQVKVKIDETIRPAIREEGRMKHTTDFKPDQEGIYVEVSLPGEAARNEFRLAIAREKQPPLAEQEFTWSRTDNTREFYFPQREIRRDGGGEGKYEVRLYSGDRLQMKRKIEIKD